MTDRRETLPVAREALKVGTRAQETGQTRVRVHTEREPVTVRAPVRVDEAVIERVPVGRVVDDAARSRAGAGVRTEGDVTIIPVYEERVVVQRQLVLVEEVHVRRVTREQTHAEQVERRVQQVEVSRDGESSETQKGEGT